jgi:ABC-type oligopeptide transport system ATPase subunit
MTEPLLQVRALDVSYGVQHRGRQVRLRALRGVGFEMLPGEALAVIGESGSGKSTLGRALLRLIEVDGGEIRFRGQDLLALRGEALRRMRRHLQMIFQDGLSALDPRMQIGAILGEPLQVFRPELTRAARDAAAGAMLERVGMTASQLARYPHEFSGGQAQRIGIARALIAGPELIVCDEPLSALDVSIKAQIAALLKSAQQELHLALLFIAHDLPAVRSLCDRVLVLYLGRVVEIAPSEALFRSAMHPYTRALGTHAALGLRVPHTLRLCDRALCAGAARVARRGRKPRGLPSRRGIGRHRCAWRLTAAYQPDQTDQHPQDLQRPRGQQAHGLTARKGAVDARRAAQYLRDLRALRLQLPPQRLAPLEQRTLERGAHSLLRSNARSAANSERVTAKLSAPRAARARRRRHASAVPSA